jgi:hypothetical protein
MGQGRDWQLDVVNKVMDLQVPKHEVFLGKAEAAVRVLTLTAYVHSSHQLGF